MDKADDININLFKWIKFGLTNYFNMQHLMVEKTEEKMSRKLNPKKRVFFT